MKIMKRLLSLAIVLCLALSIAPAALAAMPFVDIAPDAWYNTDVSIAYEMGLINGKTETTFAPNDNLTYAEAVKLAACMHQRSLYGSVTLTNGNPWYQSYVDYCMGAGIISKNYDWEQPATRAGYMEIFANALPAENLLQINDVADDSIPDVSMMHPQAAAIYKLYRAGILQGNDELHSCNPSASIKRSEVAAILTRMMDAEQRIIFSLGAIEEVPEKDDKDDEKDDNKKDDEDDDKDDLKDPEPETPTQKPETEKPTQKPEEPEIKDPNDYEIDYDVPGPNDLPIVWG